MVSAEKQGHQRVGFVELPGVFSSCALVTSGAVIEGCEELVCLGCESSLWGWWAAREGPPSTITVVTLLLSFLSITRGEF